jgi:MerR, DNA binding
MQRFVGWLWNFDEPRHPVHATLLHAVQDHAVGDRESSERAGFSLERIRALLWLWWIPRGSRRQVRARAEMLMAEIDQTLAELQGIRDTSVHLVHCYAAFLRALDWILASSERVRR